MPRHREPDISDAGQDSFLDTLTNMVGVLIILVMVVAMRAKNAPVTLSVPGPKQAAAQREFEEDVSAEQTLHREVLETAAKIRAVNATKQARLAERSRLSLMTAAAEKMLESRRNELNASAQSDYDRRRRLADAQAQLAEWENQYALAGRLQPEAVRVENYPTPLSHTVHGEELHLQLRAGRVTVLPWDDILETLKAEFASHINRMRTETEYTGRAGPIGGFRLRYTLTRQDVSMRTYEATGMGGSIVRLEQFQLLPVSTQMGEPLDVALSYGSEFREALSRHRPGRSTVTAWVYPDSFDAYRRLRKELYQLGYTMAGRPLPEGELIGGSPGGSRSAAQ
ncbi:MAG TPA: hypothetical protein VJL29_16145 [Thermoguttaceae bacterium]|nr:hypothetical protein [Thermoguttaceae bacterium]